MMPVMLDTPVDVREAGGHSADHGAASGALLSDCDVEPNSGWPEFGIADEQGSPRD